MEDFLAMLLMLTGWYLKYAVDELMKPEPDGYLCHEGELRDKENRMVR